MDNFLSPFKLLCFALLMEFCASLSFAQVGTHEGVSLVSAEDYRQILDLVFVDAPQKGDLQYSFTLRFLSSRHAESEVGVQVSNSGQIRAVLAAISGVSVWTTANEYVRRSGRENISEIAQRVRVTRQPLPISANQASLWHDEILKTLGLASAELQSDFSDLQKSGETTIFLDGTTYELRFAQGLSDIRWITMDAEVDDQNVTGRASIVKWMNMVRTYSILHAAK